jgi:hypothetical protein
LLNLAVNLRLNFGPPFWRQWIFQDAWCWSNWEPQPWPVQIFRHG